MAPRFVMPFATLFIIVVSLKFSNQTAYSSGLMYLARFGYLDPQILNPNSGQLMSQDTLANAIKDFQAFANIPVTGNMDNETVTLMQLPRCGVKDKVGYASDARSKRYALQGSRWKVKDLTYKISKYPKILNKKDVDEEIQKAFDVWSGVTPLKFTKKASGPVHIDVRFERGEHGDGDPFDGPGGTLAHAFFPVYGGDAHFDDAEKWTINSYRGTNLFQVAAHEFGHSLGLSHSDIRAALMAPFYRGYESTFELDEDDIEGIQALYGRKRSTTSQTPSPSTPSNGRKPSTEDDIPGTENDKELCSGNGIDTLFNSADGITYVFKGSNYWRLTDDAVAAGYPKLISKGWPGLPGNIDASFTYKNGKTYFFKGNQYWRYDGNKMDGRYPKKISEGFAGAPDNMDAAMVWGGNGKIYFFKGSKFWRFDPTQKPPIKSNYPKPISNWEGVPNDLNAALQYTNGYTYFFKKGNYYRFNDRSFSVDSADPSFPRPVGYWWFGCKEETKRGITAEDYEDTVQYKRRSEQQKADGPHDEATDIIMDGSYSNPVYANVDH